MPDTKHARNCKRRIVLWVHWNSLGKRQKMNGRKTWTNQIDERSGFLVVGAVGDSIGAPEYSPRLVTLVTAFASQQKRLLHFGERKWCALKCKHYYYFNCVISIMLLLFIISSSWRMLWDHALCTRNNDHMERKILHTPVLFFEYIEKPSDDCDVIGVWPHHTLDSDPSCPRLFHVSRACFNTGYSTLQSQRPCLPPSFNSHLPCPFCFAHLLPRLNFDC